MGLICFFIVLNISHYSTQLFSNNYGISFENHSKNNSHSESFSYNVRTDSMPDNLSLEINSNELFTYDSIVNLSVNADNATYMKFKNEGYSWSDWEPYSKNKLWALSDKSGLKTVQVMFKDDYNNITNPINDTIVKITSNIFFLNSLTTNTIDEIEEMGIYAEIETNQVGFIEIKKQTNQFTETGDVSNDLTVLHYYSFKIYNESFIESPDIINKVKFQLFYDPSEISNVNDLSLVKYTEDGNWVDIDFILNQEENYIEFETSSLSIYCLGLKSMSINIFFIILFSVIGSVSISSSYFVIKRKNKKKEGAVREKIKQFRKKSLPELPSPSKTINKPVITTEIKPKKLKPLAPIPLPPELALKEEEELIKTEKEVKVRKHSLYCIVHRGDATGSVYICPNCQTIYCERCAKVIKLKGESCWTCNNEIELSVSKIEKVRLLEFSSKEILTERIQKDKTLYNFIHENKNIEEFPEVLDYEFTLLSQKELDEIDLLDLNVDEKKEFISELLSMSVDNRQKILKSMLK